MTEQKENKELADNVKDMARQVRLINSEPILKTGMTNEQWLRQASTDELAEFIREQRDAWSDGWFSDHHRVDEIMEWLKEKHKE